MRIYCRWAVHHPRFLLVLSLLAGMFLSLGLLEVTFNPDMRSFLGTDNPQSQNLTELERIYGRASNVVLILTPADGDVFTREILTAIEWLTDQAWQTPHSTRVDSLANHEHSYAEGDEIIIEPLYRSAANLTPDDIELIRERAMESGELTNYLVSPAGDVTGVNILVIKPEGDMGAIAEIMDYVRDLQRQAEANYPGLAVRVSGGIPGDAAFDLAGRQDMAVLVPIMFLVIVVSLILGFRDVLATVGTLLVVVFSATTTLGLASWAGIVLTAGNGGTPVIIMTLCIADCVHVITSIAQAKARGMEKIDALQHALHRNFMPIFVTSLTTAIGFLTLNWSESPPLRDLGNMVAVGVLIAFAFSITLLPAFLALVPSPRGAKAMRGQALAEWVARVSLGHPRLMLIVSPLIFAGLAFGVFSITLEDDFVTYFDESFEFRRDTDYLQRNLTGLHAIHFSLSAGEEYGIARPDYLRAVDRFSDWYLTHEAVVQVTAVVDIIKRLNMNVHDDDPAYRRLPETREQAAQLLLIYELSVPFGRDLNSRINVSKSQTRFTVWLRDASSADIRYLAGAGEAWLLENAPELAAPATGVSVVYAYITETNIRSMIRGTAVALLVISGILFVVLRNLRLGLISLVPNLVPAVAAFGLWGYIYGEVNLAVSVVGAITLGIVVDDTVHLLAKYQRARRENPDLDVETVLRQSFASVGLALIHTSVALVLGFIVLAQSGFAISADMGLLSAIVIVAALLADLFFLPPLLLVLERNR